MENAEGFWQVIKIRMTCLQSDTLNAAMAERKFCTFKMEHIENALDALVDGGNALRGSCLLLGI